MVIRFIANLVPYGRKLWRSKSFANLQLWIFGEKYFGESVIIFTILIKAHYVYYSAAASCVPFVPSDFCDLAKMATVGFSVECMIRGYHEYKSIWENPSIGETLICEREIGNCHDHRYYILPYPGLRTGRFQRNTPH